MTIHFTSDLHLGHTNIIKYCNRPFKDAQEMDEAFVRNWNSVVQQGDQVYVLGDVALSDPEYAASLLKRLMGEKFLVEGNHDKRCLKSAVFRQCFTWTKPMYELAVPDTDAFRGEQKIVLCHYAMRVWNKSHRGTWRTWHLYGHSHGSLPEIPSALSFDVGVDANNYRPISYAEVKRRMKRKTWKPIDGHQAD